MTITFKRYVQISIICALVIGSFLLIISDKTESEGHGNPYEIDTVHSAVIFRAKHMGVTYNYGRFNEFSGDITLDESNNSNSSVELQVKTESVDTANGKRDQHLRSPDFFNAKQFPLMSFKSTKVSQKTGQENMLEVTGDLELHGVKKSITVDVEKTGQANDPKGGELVGFLTTFTIKRSEYGMTYGLQGVGDEIQITVSIEAGRK